MPKLEIIFYPDPFQSDDGKLITLKPQHLRFSLRYLKIMNTDIGVYVNPTDDNDDVARSLQRRIREIYNGVNVLENSAK